MTRLALIVLLLAGCAAAVPTPSPTASPTPSPTATPSSSPSPSPSPTPNTARYDRCMAIFTDLVDALTQVDARLDVGLTYAKYGDYVQEVSVAYDKMDLGAIKVLTLEDQAACIEAVQGLEDARNAFVQAHSAWKKCLDGSSSKYDACIAKNVQPKWTNASDRLKSAKDALDALRSS